MLMMIEILFAILVGGIGIYLLRHQSNFLGLSAKQIQKTAHFYGWALLMVAVGLLISAIFFANVVWLMTIFLILSMALTMILAVIISSKLF